MLALPDSDEKLCLLVSKCAVSGVTFTVLGKGSNVLVSDDGIRGLTIITAGEEEIRAEGECGIYCSAGTPLIRLCLYALENSLTGFEFAYGIPGSAGGAAFMNAGAYGGEMKDVLVACEHITRSGEKGTLTGSELALGYRRSAYCDNGFVITGLHLRLNKGKPEEIRAKMDELLSKRKAKQPLEYPSAGSTFKRPEGYFAGALIEENGLKGYSVGGAQVSEKHAGFVINRGGATAGDVMQLVNDVKEKVLASSGVELEPEIRFIGG